MPADIVSKPFNPEREYEYVYICRKYPMIRLVYKRKEKPGDVEQYIGFLKHAAGGIFQTDDAEVAGFLDAMIKDGEHGHQFEKLSHAELAEMLAAVPAEMTRVNRGPMATRQADRSEEVAPDEGEVRAPKAAKGPKKGKPVEA